MAPKPEIIAKIEEVCEEICDNYCKWGTILHGMQMDDQELEEFMNAHCDKCPLDKLR